MVCCPFGFDHLDHVYTSLLFYIIICILKLRLKNVTGRIGKAATRVGSSVLPPSISSGISKDEGWLKLPPSAKLCYIVILPNQCEENATNLRGKAQK
jgi:hypothetical protein